MPGVVSSLRSIGSTVGALGKSGLLGPYGPSQLLRVAALAGSPLNVGGVYRLAAALDPGGTAAVDDAGAATFAEMEARASSLAAGLAGLGVAEGGTVAVLCRNHRGFLLAVVAIGKLGADAVYLNTGFAGPQLADVVDGEGADALVIDEEFAPLLASLSRPLPVVVAWTDGAPAAGRTTMADLLAADPAAAPPPSSRSGRQVLLTSGTTGRPKGAARATPTNPAPLVGVLARIPYHRGDVTVVAAPAFHAWGFANTALGLVFGSTLILPRRFDPEDTLGRIERYRARVLVAVPVMLQRIMDLPEATRRRYDTSSLRVVALSGSALPGELALRFMDAFGEVVYNLYGSTEVGWVSVAGPDDLRRDARTAGRILPGVDVRLVDDDRRVVPADRPGRIFVRSSLTFEGYTGGGGKEVAAGYMSTGDVGHIDGGLLFVDGRDDDMIVSGGENVFPREVEDLLATHPAVADVAVVGVPDDDFGARLEAWVVLRPTPKGASPVGEDELLALVRAELARFKVPRRIHLVDGLPRNATGKVLKRELAGPAGS